MEITVGNIAALVSDASEDDERWLREYLAFEDAGAKFRRRFRKSGDGRLLLYNLWRHSFPAGLVSTVLRGAAEIGLAIEVVDGRARPCEPDPAADLGWLRDYQRAAVDACLRKTVGIVKAVTGCHARGQLVLAYDGRLLRIEDVKLGDLLMGPDSTPRRVVQLHAGFSDLVKVTPTKGDPFTVTPNHLLTLTRTNRSNPKHRVRPRYRSKLDGKIFDVRTDSIPNHSPGWRHIHKLFRVGVYFPVGPEPIIDPYLMGVLLGDGSFSQVVRVTTADPEIVQVLEAAAADWGLCVSVDRSGDRTPSYAIVGKPKLSNPLMEELRRLGLWNHGAGEKFIPHIYKTGTRSAREHLLAGLIDSDGHVSNGCCDFISKSPTLAADFAFVARSLGFAAYITPCKKYDQWGGGGIYHRVSLSGTLAILPTKIPRKQFGMRRQKKDVLRTGFKLQSQAPGEYYGVSVDGDERYLLGDFTVTHNSGKTEMFIALTRALPCRWLMLVHRTTLVRQAAERYELRTGEQAGVVSEGHWDDAPRFVCASFQTLLAGLRSTDAVHRARTTALLEGAQGVIVDEAHVVPAATTRAILTKAKHAYWRFGFSGTPLDRGDQRSIFAVSVLGPIIHEVNGKELVAAGVLAEPDIRLVTYKHAAGEDDGAGYAVVYQERVVEDAGRMGLVVAVAKACSKPAFLFVGRVEHGHRTVSALRAAGITSAFAWGARSTDERTDLVAALEAGVVEVLVCSVVFQEGIDIPSLRSVVNASGGKSIIAALQRLGRGMRKTEDKATFEVWDVLDVGQKWLAKHSRARVKAYKREGYATKTETVLQVDQLALDRGGPEG